MKTLRLNNPPSPGDLDPESHLSQLLQDLAREMGWDLEAFELGPGPILYSEYDLVLSLYRDDPALQRTHEAVDLGTLWYWIPPHLQDLSGIRSTPSRVRWMGSSRKLYRAHAENGDMEVLGVVWKGKFIPLGSSGSKLLVR